jgi:hypothetical protein
MMMMMVSVRGGTQRDEKATEKGAAYALNSSCPAVSMMSKIHACPSTSTPFL